MLAMLAQAQAIFHNANFPRTLANVFRSGYCVSFKDGGRDWDGRMNRKVRPAILRPIHTIHLHANYVK